MRKVLYVSIGAVVVVLAAAVPAYAEHSAGFRVDWKPRTGFTGYTQTWGNPDTGIPHQNYLEGPVECGACHAQHRTPTPESGWGIDLESLAAQQGLEVGGFRTEFSSDEQGNSQMLRPSDLADSCVYCHLDTSLGNKQIFVGNVEYVRALDDLGTDHWDVGFGHGNPCTSCHAAHGAADPDNDPILHERYGRFEGPVTTKVLKVRVKSYKRYWQEEVYRAGSKGKAEAKRLYGAQWASKLKVNDDVVDELNIPIFPSKNNALDGKNARPDISPEDAQVTVFCTFCHGYYGWASEATLNPDGDYGPNKTAWRKFSSGDLIAAAPGKDAWLGDGVERDPTDLYENVTSDERAGALFVPPRAFSHTHPMKNAELDPVIIEYLDYRIGQTVAFVASSSCRNCHDAGLRDSFGVIVESWPHFTPGYFQFLTASGGVESTDLIKAPIPDRATISNTNRYPSTRAWLGSSASYDRSQEGIDGHCLKCHRAQSLGVGMKY